MRVVLQSYSFTGRNGYYNLGLRYLQSALLADAARADRFTLEVLDSDYFQPIDEVVRDIAAHAPDVVGISVYVWSRDLVPDLIERVAKLPGRPFIVCGGRGLEGTEEQFLRDNPELDAVVTRDGEQAFIALLDTLERVPGRSHALDRVHGLTYRDQDGAIRRANERPAGLLLSDIPSPYLTGLFEPPEKSVFYTQTSIYCPHACSNCSWVRHRCNVPDNAYPMTVVRQELAWAVARGYERVYLFDAAINYDPARFTALMDIIDDVGNDQTTFLFFLKHETITREQVARLQATRRRVLVFLGVETFSPAALQILGRPNPTDRLGPLLDALLKNPRVRVVIGLMLGLPGDDLASFTRTLAFFARYDDVGVIAAPLVVTPGTDIWRDAERHGLVFDRDGGSYLHSSRSFPRQDLEAAFDLVLGLGGLDNDRIALSTIWAPLGGIMNPAALPPEVRGLSADRWLKVGVTRLAGGRVEARGLYGVAPAGDPPPHG